jgi:hypothetical protein
VKFLNIKLIEITFTNLNSPAYKTESVFITNTTRLMFHRQIATGQSENHIKLANIFSRKNAEFS